MRRARRVVRADVPPVASEAAQADFSDVQSAAVLAEVARALAVALGQQAAREVFAQMNRSDKEPR